MFSLFLVVDSVPSGAFFRVLKRTRSSNSVFTKVMVKQIGEGKVACTEEHFFVLALNGRQEIGSTVSPRHNEMALFELFYGPQCNSLRTNHVRFR